MRHLARISGLVALLLPGAAWADSPQSISVYFPGFVEDTATADRGEVELQMGGSFAQFRHGAGRDWALAPNVNVGVTKNLELSVGGSYSLGTTAEANTGAGGFGLFYRFNDQSAWLPSLALEADYAAPAGVGHKTEQTTLRGIATKWLGASEHAPRLDLNLAWYHATNPAADNRRNRLDIGIALTQEVRPDLALVAEFYHAQREDRGQSESIADLGLLWQASEDWVLGASAGAGIGRYSPAFEVTFGVQRSFRLF